MTGFSSDYFIHAAERFELHFEDMSIPISIEELNDWANDTEASRDSELSNWLNLLGFKSRVGLVKFFQTPFIKDKEMSLQLLRSWFGRKMLDEISDLIRLDEDTSGITVANTLETLLTSKEEVTLLDLVQSIPVEVIHLDLDGMVKVANSWRKEISQQEELLSNLAGLNLQSKISRKEEILSNELQESNYELFELEVTHRSEPLSIEIWSPYLRERKRSSWIVFMPGLGGDREHFRWLSRSLAHNGWPIVLLDHPGSNSDSLKALLEGKLPAPGLEVIPDRLADIREVLRAKDKGIFDIDSEDLILMGHSLGSLTAFLSSGEFPQQNLDSRCEKSLDNFSITNLSAILQCQIVDFELQPQPKLKDLKAIVGLNSFGSLLWPTSSVMQIDIPVFLTGGTFDLITPAITEQLQFLMATKPNPLSRILLIEGASHFSPIRVKGQLNQSTGKDVFQIGESFVGFHPLSVQSLLAEKIVNFLDKLEEGESVYISTNQVKDGLKFHILDRSIVKKLIAN